MFCNDVRRTARRCQAERQARLKLPVPSLRAASNLPLSPTASTPPILRMQRTKLDCAFLAFMVSPKTSTALPQQTKIFFPRNPRGFKIIPDDGHWYFGVAWNDHRSNNSLFYMGAMTAFLPGEPEPCSDKDTLQLSPMNGTDSRQP